MDMNVVPFVPRPLAPPPSSPNNPVSPLAALGYGLGPGALENWPAWREALDSAELRATAAAMLLLDMPDDAARFTWIEQELFTSNDFPPPDVPADPYRTALMRWWLDIFDKQTVR